MTTQLALLEPCRIVEVRRESNYEYQVRNRVTGVQGFVFATKRQLRDFKEGSLLYQALSPDFDEREGVLDIDLFAPHGEEEPNPAFTQRGIGSYVLNIVLADMVQEKMGIAYSHEPSLSAYNLFLKNGFEEVNDGKQRELFKRLYRQQLDSRKIAA